MKENIQVERKLGRGLSALIGESNSKKEIFPSNSSNSSMVEVISISKIEAGIYQPRIDFSQIELEELAESIKENGLIQPIILRKIRNEDRYEIIAGERRFRASQIAGMSEISAIVKKINNHEALEMALIENIQREDLSVIEEAEGYKRLMSEFSYNQDHIAKKVGKSRSHIANLLRLLNLPESVQKLIAENKISMGHARAIINSHDPEKLAHQIISDSLNVREIEDLVRDEKIEDLEEEIDFHDEIEPKKKLVKSNEMAEFELRLFEVTGMKNKISYNSLKNNGKVTFNFRNFEQVQQLILKLEQCQ